VSAARAFVRFSQKMARSSFGVTDGTFLLLVLFFFGWPKKKRTSKQLGKANNKDNQ